MPADKSSLGSLGSLAASGGSIGTTSTAARVGDFNIVGGTLDNDYSFSDNTLTILKSTALTISNADPTIPTADHIYIAPGITANLTLAGVNISVEGNIRAINSADRNHGGCTLNLTLASETNNSLAVHGGARDGYPAVFIDGESHLNIDGSGSLNAFSTEGPGIYGGRITITSGTVNSQTNITKDPTAGLYAYGLTITGGTVTAQNNDNTSSSITVNSAGMLMTGGIVSATNPRGAAIGGGNISIKGGTLTLKSGGGGALGSGSFSTGGTSGHAFIDSDKPLSRYSSDWGGAIIQGDSGQVYGNPTLICNATVPKNKMLSVPAGNTLGIEKGVTLVNEGAIENAGTLTNDGSLANNTGATINNRTSAIGGTGALTNDGIINNPSTIQLSAPQTISYGDNATLSATISGKLPSGASVSTKGRVDFYLSGSTAKVKLGSVSALQYENNTLVATLPLSPEVWAAGGTNWKIGNNNITAVFSGTSPENGQYGLFASTSSPQAITVAKGEQAPDTVPVDQSLVTYGAAAPAITVLPVADGAKVTYTAVSDTGGLSASDVARIDGTNIILQGAGTFYVKAVIDPTNYYNAKTIYSTKIVVSPGASTFNLAVKNNGTPTNTFTYGDAITVEVSGIQVKPPAGKGTLARGTVCLYTSDPSQANGKSSPIANANVQNGTATLTYHTPDKKLNVGDNVSLWVAYSGDDNLKPSMKEISVNLKPKELSATVNSSDASATKTYDGTGNFTKVALHNLTNIESNDNVSATANGKTASTDASVNQAFTATSVTLEGADKDFYALENAHVSGTVTITKAPLTITAMSKTITYGDKPANNGVRYDGFVHGENEGVLGGVLNYLYDYAQFGDVGDYTITPEGFTSSNYTISYETGTLSVNPKEVGLVWSNSAHRVFGDGLQVSALASGTVDGDVIGVTVTGGAQTQAGTYTAKATKLTGEKAVNYKLPSTPMQNYTIERSGTDLANHITVSNEGDVETNTFTYGDTLTVHATPTPTAQVPTNKALRLSSADTQSVSANKAAALTTPQPNQMALFYGKTQISDAVNPDAGGTYTMVYNTQAGIVPAGNETITVHYVGDANKADATAAVSVTINPIVLTPTLTGVATQAYDATVAVKDDSKLSIALDAPLHGDNVSATANYAFTSANAGTTEVVASNIQLQGPKKDFYSVASTTKAHVVGGITKATSPAATTGSLTVKNGMAHTYDFDLSALLPSVTGVFGDAVYTLDSVDLPTDLYTGGASISDSTLSLPTRIATSDAGTIGSVKVMLSSTNYADILLTLTINASTAPVLEGSPTLGATHITYGEPLSTITLSGTMTLVGDAAETRRAASANATSAQDIPGIFTWDAPDTVAQAGTYQAAWTYTPDNTAAYSPVHGTSSLSVTPKKVGLIWSGTEGRVAGDGKKVSATATGLLNKDAVSVRVIGGDATTAGTHEATATGLSGNAAANYVLPQAATITYTIAAAPTPGAKPGSTPGTTQAHPLPGPKKSALVATGDSSIPGAISLSALIASGCALFCATRKARTRNGKHAK